MIVGCYDMQLCSDRQSAHGEPFVDGKCAECVAFEGA